MAEIAEGGGGHEKGGKRRAKKQSTKVDMTPMVDLAFLLLTFFVLTATFNKNKAMDITFPAPPEKIEDVPPVKNAVTFILSKDHRVFYYYGQLITADTKPEENKENLPPTTLTEITYAPEKGIVDLLMGYNSKATEKIKKLDEDRQKTNMPDSVYKKEVSKINNTFDAVTVIIKADDKATYRDVITLIDQLKVLKISKFVNVDITKPEFDMAQALVSK